MVELFYLPLQLIKILQRFKMKIQIRNIKMKFTKAMSLAHRSKRITKATSIIFRDENKKFLKLTLTIHRIQIIIMGTQSRQMIWKHFETLTPKAINEDTNEKKMKKKMQKRTVTRPQRILNN